MDSTRIRTIVITALFSDDELMHRLVLKGGSALELVHRCITRGSFDVDVSIADEFQDIEDVHARLVRALRDRFDAAGYVVFDHEFIPRPPVPRHPDPTPWWGGYTLEFKIVSREQHARYGHDLSRLRNHAEAVDPGGGRRFRVEISKHEFCAASQEVDFEGFRILVYSPEMSVLEKLRAICQQMPDYRMIPRERKRARARDFFDIHALVARTGVDLSLEGNHEMCRRIFQAKRVPLVLLPRIAGTREFHRTDWPRVQDTTREETKEFDDYFDFVTAEVRKLEPLWVV